MKKKYTLKRKIILLIILIAMTLICRKYNIKIDTNDIKLKQIDSSEVKEAINTTSDENLNIYYLNVGQGDSILITKNSKNILIDAGNNEDGPKLVKFFQEMGITSFEYIIGTHAHEDHIGGIDDIIKNFKVKHFYMPETLTTSKTFEDTLDALSEKQIAFETPKVGDRFYLSGTTFTVLSVDSNTEDLNDSSIVLKLKYNSNSFLFMGDASTNVEQKILNKNITCDVIKIGHHGSKYSSSKDFLIKSNPTYAIISVGKKNDYYHPHDVTLNRLKNLNIKTYRTDKNGTIKITSNGNLINIEKLKTDTNG